MATSTIKTVFQHLRKAVLRREVEANTDGQLLKRFIDGRDEMAFEALVLRHGPMVLGVCRRVLGNADDADDAFQAAFLILVRKADSIGNAELLGNWLYGVAYRTALEARGKVARRRTHEIQVKDMPHPVVVPEADGAELAALLDQELKCLPDRYRVPVVLCELQGRTRKEVARQLRVPEGTLSSRLATARKMLAKRLARHGLSVSGGALAAALTQNAAACVPASLVQSTVNAASSVAAGTAVTTAVVSARVAGLMEGVLKAMFIQKIKVMIAVLMVVAFAGGGLLTYRTALGTVAAQEGQGGADAEAAARAKAAAAEAARAAAAREAAAKAAREKESPTVPAPAVGGDGKVVDFEQVSISIRPSGLNPRQPESIMVYAGGARGDGFCEYRVEERAARGDIDKWDAGYLSHTLDPKRLLRLEELLKKTDWLTAAGHEGPANALHATKYTLAVKRKGKTRTVTLDGEKGEPYKSLVTFFHGIALQEDLVYRLERLPLREHNDACRQIELYVLAEKGGPYAKPLFEIDMRRYVPTFQRYVRNPHTHSREELTPALRLLGHLRSEIDREYIAALANDRDTYIRIAVAEALGTMGGKESVPVLRRMLRSTPEAAWQLVQLRSLAVPTVVEVIESGKDPSDERQPDFLDYQRLIRAYLDNWAKAPRPVDPRVLDAVRKSMTVPKIKGYSTAYHKELLELAAPELEKSVGDLPQGLDFLRPYPEFHKFRFGQDEAMIQAIVAQHALTITGSALEGYFVTRSDGERLALSMRDGKCSGIKRLRGN